MATGKGNDSRVKRLGQYLTPVWAAHEIVARYFGHLGPSDFVVEPACGEGAFLLALPPDVPAIGVDIDPDMVRRARAATGRTVILGDFATVELDASPTAIIGNPPFNLRTIDTFLARAHQILPNGGQVGFIMPAYSMQTASRVAGYSERWSMQQEMIPRNIFSGKQPLIFSVFTKDRRRRLFGFALYHETADVQKLKMRYRGQLGAGSGPVWLNVVRTAIRTLGGEADLAAIYSEVAGGRPTTTNFWREQIRKVVRQHTDVFKAVGRGRYAIHDVATAATAA